MKNLKNCPVSFPEINPWKEWSHTKADTNVFCSCPILLDFFDFSLEKSRKYKSVKLSILKLKNVQDYITLNLVPGVYCVHFACLQLQAHVSYFKTKQWTNLQATLDQMEITSTNQFSMPNSFRLYLWYGDTCEKGLDTLLDIRNSSCW